MLQTLTCLTFGSWVPSRSRRDRAAPPRRAEAARGARAAAARAPDASSRRPADRLRSGARTRRAPRRTSLQNFISQLRKTLGPEVLETKPPGYRLDIAPGPARPRRASGAGRDCPRERRAGRARDDAAEALGALARPAAGRLRIRGVRPAAHRANSKELRLATLEERVDADLEAGAPRRARRRARGTRRAASRPGAAARPLHARALPLGSAGRGARRLPGRAPRRSSTSSESSRAATCSSCTARSCDRKRGCSAPDAAPPQRITSRRCCGRCSTGRLVAVLGAEVARAGRQARGAFRLCGERSRTAAHRPVRRGDEGVRAALRRAPRAPRRRRAADGRAPVLRVASAAFFASAACRTS